MTKVTIVGTDEHEVHEVRVRNLTGAYPWELYGNWTPSYGTTYYYIHSSGAIKEARATHLDRACSGRIAIGNVFKSREDADLALSKIKELLSRVR